MQGKQPFCYKICPAGKEFFSKLINDSDSIFDVVSDFTAFCSKCYDRCPHKNAREWQNPDGVEWWNLKNIEKHTFGNDHKELIGNIMSIERYRKYIMDNFLISYDGIGYYCTQDEILDEHSDFDISLIDRKIKKGYKYVIWCNK